MRAMSNNVKRAYLFAKKAHESVNQVRKYTDQPYIVHPVEVMRIVESVPWHTEAMLMAAVMHDVLEDTPVTEAKMRAEFGDEVTDLVVWLTDVSVPSDGNRKVRKEIDRNHSAQAPAEAQTIKYADLISNTDSIVKYDPDFARTYLPEKGLLLEVMTKGDSTLRARALQIYQEGLESLA